MLRSLRARLLLAVGLVVVVSLAAVGFLSSGITRLEFHDFLRYEEQEQPGAGLLERIASLSDHYLERGSWTGVDDRLEEIVEGEPSPRSLLLLDENGRLVGASSPQFRGMTVEPLPGGGIRAHGAAPDGSPGAGLELMFVGGDLPILDGHGRTIGTVWILPPRSGGDLTPEARFLGSVNRWLIAGVAVAGLLALIVTALLARRILGPVEALTKAASAMGEGRLDQRVPVKGRDEIGELARAFNGMAESLERAEQLRRRLVGDVAHELRTPLTSIRCQVESIQEKLVEPGPEVIASIQEEVLALSRLVDDLQDLALAEAGQLRLDRRPVPLEETARAVARALAATAGGKHPEVRIELDELPQVDGDPERLRQILRNLLENALRHTPPEGSVELTGQAAGGWVDLRIRDTGPGIDPEHLPHLFDRFYRADPSRERATGGAGLGLAIVKQLVEAHGGRVSAESRPGAGTTFTVRLPAAQA